MDNWISNDKYKEIIESMPICCVDLVIHNKGKVLVIKRDEDPDKGKWAVIGGRVYKNEKLRETAIRKAYEEVGLKIQIEKQIGVYEMIYDKTSFGEAKTGYHNIIIIFLAKPIDKDFKIIIDKTSSDFKWINKIEDNLCEYAKRILKDSKILNL